MSDSQFTRRQALRNALGLMGAMAGLGSAAAETCRPTLRQGEGPYYPQNDVDRDNDLLVGGRPGHKPHWEAIHIFGTVKDEDCAPIPGAHVEIWQAGPSGRYNHSEDPNHVLHLDPDFQHWGRTKTTATGEYGFRSLIPGHYPLHPRFAHKTPTGPGQFRPPHIHFRAHARDFLSLTTQMYFDPDSFADPDRRNLVADLNRWENVPKDLVVSLKTSNFGFVSLTFDIVLRKA